MIQKVSFDPSNRQVRRERPALLSHLKMVETEDMSLNNQTRMLEHPELQLESLCLQNHVDSMLKDQENSKLRRILEVA